MCTLLMAAGPWTALSVQVPPRQPPRARRRSGHNQLVLMSTCSSNPRHIRIIAGIFISIIVGLQVLVEKTVMDDKGYLGMHVPTCIGERVRRPPSCSCLYYNVTVLQRWCKCGRKWMSTPKKRSGNSKTPFLRPLRLPLPPPLRYVSM